MTCPLSRELPSHGIGLLPFEVRFRVGFFHQGETKLATSNKKPHSGLILTRCGIPQGFLFGVNNGTAPRGNMLVTLVPLKFMESPATHFQHQPLHGVADPAGVFNKVLVFHGAVVLVSFV